MKAPTHFEYRIELHGWRKFWARLRRKPWAWVYEAEVEVDLTPHLKDNGDLSYGIRPVTPLRKREAS